MFGDGVGRSMEFPSVTQRARQITRDLESLLFDIIIPYMAKILLLLPYVCVQEFKYLRIIYSNVTGCH